MRPNALVLLPALFLVGCVDAHCPEGQTAVKGACYPAEAVEQVGGDVPVLCEPACTGSSHCNYADGTCVACAVDAHCTDPTAPSCDPSTHACGGCYADSDCTRFVDAPYCDVVRGSCAACTPENEDRVCGDGVCDVVAGRCTTFERHSRGACERCHADSECKDSMRCVSYSYYGHVPERVCLFDAAKVQCATSSSSPLAPYVVEEVAPTLRGESVTVCRPTASCAALEDYASATPCSVTSDCAAPLGGSHCAGPSEPRPGVCTMFCLSPSPGSPGACLGTDVCGTYYCEPAP